MKPVQNFNHYLSQRLNDIIEAASEQEVHTIQRQLEARAHQLDQITPVAVKYFCCGFRALKLGKIKEALMQFSDGLTKCQEAQHIAGLKYCIEFGIGIAFLRLGNYAESIVALTKASECRTINNEALSSRIHNNLGYIFLETGDYSKAHYYCELAYSKHNDEALISSFPVLSNLAYINSKLGNVEKAEAQFSHYRAALNAYPNTIGEHYYYSAYGSHLEILGRIDDALEAFKGSIRACEKLNDNFFLIDTLKEYCACAITHDRQGLLEPYLSLAIELTNEFGSAKSLQFFADLLMKVSDKADESSTQVEMVKRAFHLQSQALKRHSDSNYEAISQLYRLHSERPELENAQSLAENLDLISSFGEYLSTHSSVTDMVFRLYKDLNKVMPVECLAIGLYDEKSDQLEYKYFVDLGELLEPFTIQCSEEATLSTYCIQNKQAFIHGQFSSAVLNQLLEQPPTHQAFVGVTNDDYPSIIMIPLILEGKVLGILTAQTHLQHAYQDYHFSLVKHLCSYIAIDIQNKQQKKQLELQKKELKKLVHIDPLSGLYNRLSLTSSLDTWRSSKSHCSKRAVMLIDIDYYKQFNDYYGHIKGDEVLVTLAKLLQRNFSTPLSKVFRFGGDEFLILCECFTPQELQSRIEELLHQVQGLAIRHQASDCGEHITLSIGVAMFEQDDINALANEEMIQKADEALYRVKAKGRNGALIEYANIEYSIE